MSLLQDLAFSEADVYCRCEEGDLCSAGAYSDGYVAGFKRAREMAAVIIGTAWGNKVYRSLFIPDALTAIAEDIRSLGEADASTAQLTMTELPPGPIKMHTDECMSAPDCICDGWTGWEDSDTEGAGGDGGV